MNIRVTRLTAENEDFKRKCENKEDELRDRNIKYQKLHKT